MNGRCRPSECTADKGVITHKASGRTTTYGKVADAAGKLEVPKEPPLKDPKDWKIAGKPVKRLDTPDKITGKQVYGIDIKLPGMLNAAIKQCPVIGGEVEELRRRQGRRHEGRQESRSGRRRRGRGRRRHLVARQDRPRCTAQSSGTKAKTPRYRAQRSPRC